MQEIFEKIKKRLEDTKGIAFLTLANTGDKTRDIVYDEVMVYLNTAIEIVNQVAEEYSNSEIPNMSKKLTSSSEFCEWVQEGEDEYVNCKYVYQEINSGDVDYFKFCPYCGKKIKVVPYQLKGESNGK